MMDDKRRLWEEKKDLLLNLFLEVTAETFLSVQDVKEILQTGYEFFLKKQYGRGINYGTNGEKISGESKE